MKKILSVAVPMASVIVAGVEGQRLFGTAAAAETSAARAGGVPVFDPVGNFIRAWGGAIDSEEGC